MTQEILTTTVQFLKEKDLITLNRYCTWYWFRTTSRSLRSRGSY
jgi:phage terminase small subunit